MPALDILSELRRVLGGDAVLPRAQIQQHRHADWSGLPAQAPLALLRPRDTRRYRPRWPSATDTASP